MDKFQELINTAQALKTVKVDGEYWALMHVAVQNILKVAEAIRGEQDAVNNNIKS